MRSLGATLALLALLLQAVLPLADARWHASQHAEIGGLISAPAAHTGSNAVGVKANPTNLPSHAPDADDVCQLCIGMQGLGSVLASAAPPLAVPTLLGTIDQPSRDQVTATAPRGRPHQPRAPPVQA